MNKTQVVTLRVPAELKQRLESEAHLQGVSMNNLANYLLTTQISLLEALSTIEARMANKSYIELKKRVNEVLNSVQKNNNIPVWDQID
ncbi:MAG: toxin-antitoxin system HicB family antitoxin [Thiotrichaceae bacterium]|nr:toxin-antitoxin system HicB family antitoxin [Thiotrichaceae bacterium]